MTGKNMKISHQQIYRYFNSVEDRTQIVKGVNLYLNFMRAPVVNEFLNC